VKKYKQNDKFNYWILIEKIPKQGWMCRCDCGTERIFKKIYDAGQRLFIKKIDK